MITMTIQAADMADLISQVRMFIGQQNREPAPPEGADVNVDRKATQPKKRAVKPPVAAPEPISVPEDEEELGDRGPAVGTRPAYESADEQDAADVFGDAQADIAQLLKLKNDTISVLQDAFAQGKVVKLRKLLMTHGDGAKSFPEVDPVKFIEISEAVKAGALNG